jgi:hypothetical protein
MKRLLAFATLALLMAGTSFAQNLVTNGGFELGNTGGLGHGGFAGWNPYGELQADFESEFANTFLDNGDGTYDGVTPFADSYEATFGAVGSPSGIHQSIGTVAGHTYHVSFWVKNDDGCGTTVGCSSINVTFGGVTLINNTLEDVYDWRFDEFDVTATDSSSDLIFNIRQDPNYYYLDNVSVVDSTPEPATLTLLGSALGLGAGFIRRFRS